MKKILLVDIENIQKTEKELLKLNDNKFRVSIIKSNTF